MFCKTESSHHYFGCNADKSGSYYTIQNTVRQAKTSNGNETPRYKLIYTKISQCRVTTDFCHSIFFPLHSALPALQATSFKCKPNKKDKLLIYSQIQSSPEKMLIVTEVNSTTFLIVKII